MRVAKVHRLSRKKRKFRQLCEFCRLMPISGGPSKRKTPVCALKPILSRVNLDRRDSLAERRRFEPTVRFQLSCAHG